MTWYIIIRNRQETPKKEDKDMMKQSTKELKNIVKNILIAQGGKAYNYNYNTLRAQGYNTTAIQNAFNYYEFSPTQAKFRESLGM